MSRSRTVPRSSRRGPLVLVASDAADGRAGQRGVERELLAAPRERRCRSASVVPARTTRDEVAGRVLDHAGDPAGVEHQVDGASAAPPQSSLVPRAARHGAQVVLGGDRAAPRRPRR